MMLAMMSKLVKIAQHPVLLLRNGSNDHEKYYNHVFLDDMLAAADSSDVIVGYEPTTRFFSPEFSGKLKVTLSLCTHEIDTYNAMTDAERKRKGPVKILIFSSSVQMLNVIQFHIKAQPRWKFCRYDGKMNEVRK
jgi:SNF2 family DNA or RNA helicase